MPDFMAAYYAAVCSVKDGEVAEVEIMAAETTADRTVTLSVTIRREALELEAET
jgi:hypothetical protein